MRKSSLIVGAGLSQFHDDPDMYEFLVSYSDGREIGYQMPKEVAIRIAKDMAYEFSWELDAAKAAPVHDHSDGNQEGIGK